MALRIISIYVSEPEQKVESGFGLCGDGLFNGLLLGVFLTAIFLGLGTDGRP